MRPLHHSYRERTQWVKAQYAQDLRRIRDVQEKLFRRARELKSQVERQELAASQQLHTGGDDAFCATRDDHVKRMAKDSSGMVKELAGNVAQLQAELDEMRQKMQRERTARIASETAKREFQDRLAEKEGLLDELRDKCVVDCCVKPVRLEGCLAPSPSPMLCCVALVGGTPAQVQRCCRTLGSARGRARRCGCQDG